MATKCMLPKGCRSVLNHGQRLPSKADEGAETTEAIGQEVTYQQDPIKYDCEFLPIDV